MAPMLSRRCRHRLASDRVYRRVTIAAPPTRRALIRENKDLSEPVRDEATDVFNGTGLPRACTAVN